jgi:hypothetical protein
MKTTFLDYYKMVLDKVSFDRHLFVKEYHKAVDRLSANEVADLNAWLKSQPHTGTFLQHEVGLRETVIDGELR